jgi:6-phosphogluconate dehydrogenase
MDKADIGIAGLGVMGHNLAMNMERNGYGVAGYDLDARKIQFLLENPASASHFQGAHTPGELMNMLKKPRRVLMMVPAGPPVDGVITQFKPFMEPGDILIDGGNSYFQDTEKRSKQLAEEGFHFVGMGVSGGEEGALLGPSLMPGGSRESWDALGPILTAISAKAPEDGRPCVTYIGPRGAGHYVKMVHNGIEYGIMQLIAEAYDLMRRAMGMSVAEMSKVFREWDAGPLHSYLIEITAEVLERNDPDTGKPMVDIILDEAEQKGTGEWTAQNALDIGAPDPTISSAVLSRIISSLKTQRVQVSQVLHGPTPSFNGERKTFLDAIRDALYLSEITTYTQGMNMLRCASSDYSYDLKLADIAAIWRGGCIIRAQMLNDIMDAYHSKPDLENLMVDEHFRPAFEHSQMAWRQVVQQAVGMGIPVAALSASLAYFDAYRTAVLPANLTQAQRDFFGAHTYHRVDKEGVFHTEWKIKEKT